MATFIGLLVVAALVGAVVWNKRNASAAMDGVAFVLPASPTEVAAAIASAFNVGAAAKLKGMIEGVRVLGSGQSFRYESRIGDVGRLELNANGGGTEVRAATTQLYVGTHPRSHSRGGGLWSTASALAHGIYKVLGVTPGAARMKRFQRRLEARVAKQLGRVAH
jgi:hypothetical protein